MKTKIIVSILMIVLSISSCKKDVITNDITETKGLISLDQLNGTWNFKSFEYNNVVYTKCAELESVPVLKNVEAITLNIKTNLGVSNNKIINSCDITGNCSGGHGSGYFSLDNKNNQIIFDSGLNSNGLIFTITSFDSTNNILVLKVTSINNTWGYILNSIYILKK